MDTETRTLNEETLSAMVARRGALAIPEVVDIFAQLREALAVPHWENVAHGRLSPDNIGVVPSETGSFTVTLLEAGAPQVDEGFDAATTRSGAKAGIVTRPMWAAPEQAKSGETGPFTDVWTLGLIAFYSLTGQSYWRETEGQETESSLSSPLLREVLTDPLVGASLRATELGVILPIEFDAWFARCVARDPRQRFPTAGEANAELCRALSPRVESQGSAAPSMTSVPPTALYAAVAPAKRKGPSPFARITKDKRVLVGGIGGLAVLVAAALVITLVATSKKAPVSASDSDDTPRAKSSSDTPSLDDWLLGKSDWVTDPKTDPRAKTLLVKVTPPPKLVETFQTVSARVENPRLKLLFSGFALGGTGSGFVMVRRRESSPMVFVITNRHVISESEEVELNLDDGSKVAGEVIYADDRNDVAVIGFTGKNAPFSAGLKLAKDPVADLDSVVATGYPFLAGKPSFQISKGEVRNHAFERNFDDELKQTYIQHSASIDPGSSGGPLFNAKNEVVGINTGFLPEKHDVFLALPASVINDAIDRAVEVQALRSNPEWRKAGITKACKELAAELGSPKPRFRVFMQFISNRFVATDGFSTFLSESLDATTGATLANVFESDPMDGMRDALLGRVYGAVSESGGIAQDACGELNPTDAADIVNTPVIRMAFNLKDGPSEIGWTFEHGHWRVASAPLERRHRR